MDVLRQAAAAYAQLIGKEYQFTFSSGTGLRVVFKAENFKHLAGLHKLKDVYWFASEQYGATRLFKMACSGQINEAQLKNSRFYDVEARQRLESLCRIAELFALDGCVIYPFDRQKCRVRVSFRSDAIFFKPEDGDYYITFGAAKDARGQYHYPETLFYRFNDAYIAGQEIATITGVQVVEYTRKPRA